MMDDSTKLYSESDLEAFRLKFRKEALKACEDATQKGYLEGSTTKKDEIMYTFLIFMSHEQCKIIILIENYKARLPSGELLPNHYHKVLTIQLRRHFL